MMRVFVKQIKKIMSVAQPDWQNHRNLAVTKKRKQ